MGIFFFHKVRDRTVKIHTLHLARRVVSAATFQWAGTNNSNSGDVFVTSSVVWESRVSQMRINASAVHLSLRTS